MLTNGIIWRAYKIGFAKPISNELVLDMNVLGLNPRSDADLELAFLLSKEGWQRSKLGEYHNQKEALSRFSIAALVMSDSIGEVIRRELRRMSPGVRVELADVRTVLENEVLKRDVLEGDRATLAKRLVSRASGKPMRVPRQPAEVAQSSNAPGEQAVIDRDA